MDQQILSSLQQLEKSIAKIASAMVTKEDARSFATKDDLKKMQNEITEDLSSVIQDFANELDEKKADKTQFHVLHDRLTIVEQEVLQLHNKS